MEIQNISSSECILFYSAGLDGRGLRSLSHAPTHAILKLQMWYVALLKHCVVCFPICSWIHSVSILLITLFSVAFIKCSVRVYSTFYLLFCFHKVIFSFSCTCHLLNTLKRISNHSVYEVLHVFLQVSSLYI